jgi:hypothetical protein
MTRPGDRFPPTVLQCKLDDAALLLSALPVKDWGRWILYLLQALEDIAQERDQEAALHEMLAELCTDIAASS